MSALDRECLRLRARYDEEPSHSDHVAGLALQLFDALAAWHRLGPRGRELLYCAARLHDIGWSQTPDGKGHHKWSARLIREFTWKQLSREEVEVVAEVARYHRKATPQPDHADFQALTVEKRREVMMLGGMLRIADALDRTHTARIVRVEAGVKDSAITLRVEAAGPCEAELEMVEAKRDMLEEVAGRPVRCVADVSSARTRR